MEEGKTTARLSRATTVVSPENESGTPPTTAPSASSKLAPATREMRVTRFSTRTRPHTNNNVDEQHPICSLVVARVQQRAEASTAFEDVASENRNQVLAVSDLICSAGRSDHAGLLE